MPLKTTRIKPPIRTQIRENFRTWAGICTRHPWPVAIAGIVFTLGLAAALPHMVFENQTSNYLRDQDPEFIRYNEFRAQFGLDDHIMIAISPPEIFNLAFLEKLRTLHEAVEELPDVAEVNSLINARDTRGEGDTLVVEDLMEKWPTGDADLEALRDKVFANPLYLDQLISRDGSLTTLIVRPVTYSSSGVDEMLLDGFDDDAAPSVAEAEFLSSTEKRQLVFALDELLPAFESEDFRIHVAAGAVTEARLTQMLLQEVTKYSIYSTLAIAVLLITLFRRIWGLILPLIVVACSLTSTLGIMVLLNIPLSMSLQMVPLFTMCVGVCASVHVLVLVFQQMDRGVEKADALA
ncbi:MAG: MMPL family transporter, partial [Deltaproteobacteria bacterium]|nr:MMPL family transporter [Deltaproteobacteria bacterium]